MTLNQQSQRRWNGQQGEIWQWRWLNQVTIPAGDDALLVNWSEPHLIHEETGQIINSRCREW